MKVMAFGFSDLFLSLLSHPICKVLPLLLFWHLQNLPRISTSFNELTTFSFGTYACHTFLDCTFSLAVVNCSHIFNKCCYTVSFPSKPTPMSKKKGIFYLFIKWYIYIYTLFSCMSSLVIIYTAVKTNIKKERSINIVILSNINKKYPT